MERTELGGILGLILRVFVRVVTSSRYVSLCHSRNPSIGAGL